MLFRAYFLNPLNGGLGKTAPPQSVILGSLTHSGFNENFGAATYK